MTFWDRIQNLCEEHHTTPTGLCKSLGLSTSMSTRWKNGTIPNDPTMEVLAQALGVTAHYLMWGNDNPIKKAPAAEAEEADELNEMLEELKNRPEMRMLFSLAKGATKEDVELAVQIIERMRRNGGDGT